MVGSEGGVSIPTAPDLRCSTPCSDENVASILSHAERSAQAELLSSSDVLELVGCVLRDRAGGGGLSPATTAVSSASPCPALRARIGSMGSGFVVPGIALPTLLPPLPISPQPASSPHPSPALSPTFDAESMHLPGKFGSLTSAEVQRKLTCSPTQRTELLSKLDGLDRIVPSSSSIASSSSIDAGDELVKKVARSCSAISAAMENAHAHADRIKTNNNLAKAKNHQISLRPSIPSQLSRPRSSLALSNMAMEKSVRTCSQSMPLWVQRKVSAETGKRLNSSEDESGYFGQYEIILSETIITHVLDRGHWTWALEWSPDGKYLALATENHGLAIVEAGLSSPIWKVVHDAHIGKVRNDTTHSIRSIAWGGTFIAVGGTGDAVSIVEPRLASGSNQHYSFDVVDVLIDTGFVGSLSWLKNSNILAIGNRADQCLIAEIRRGEAEVTSGILHNIPRSDWVSAVTFSHGGTKLAVGDRSGLLSVYLFVMIRPGEAPALSPLQDQHLDDAILEVQWSHDDKLLFIGGEDYCITIMDTAKYTVRQRIGRDRWVTFLAPARGGAYLAGGGGAWQVSLFEVHTWKEVTQLPVAGGIPLSAKWHPHDDKYLAIAGQSEAVIVYESSCQRLPQGKCLRTTSSILAVESSPDGNVIAVGNERGLVTFFENATDPQKVLETIYETVIGVGGDMSIEWSRNGQHVAISSGSTFVLLDASYSGKVGRHPHSSARFLVRNIIQSGVNFTSLTLSTDSRSMALTNDQTRILDLTNGCKCVRVLDQSNSMDVSSGWNEDGSVFAMAGGRSNLSIYDVIPSSLRNWELLFSIPVSETITALCWGPSVRKGLQYLAFGGDDSVVILEIRITRAQEEQNTEHHQENEPVPNPPEQQLWESVLRIPCDAYINDLVWNNKGMLCIGDDDGTVSVVDLSYLKSGKAVSEMNYNWQRQGIISQTKLTRNCGRNAITSLCWIPASQGGTNQDLLAVGGTDGIVEVIDLSKDSQL